MSLLARLFPKSRRPRKASTSEVRAFFEGAAQSEEHYPSTIDPRIQFVQVALSHFGDLNGKRVIDVGCGKGRFARIFQQENPGAMVAAVDIAEAMLAHATGLERAAATMTQLPFRDNSFDAACAIESLEHAVDVPKAISEICRVVRPGGKVMILDKNVEKWGHFETPDWEQWFDRSQVEKILRRYCSTASSRPIAYWEDVQPDGLFLVWLAVK